jgi:hypothetical protein
MDKNLYQRSNDRLSRIGEDMCALYLIRQENICFLFIIYLIDAFCLIFLISSRTLLYTFPSSYYVELGPVAGARDLIKASFHTYYGTYGALKKRFVEMEKRRSKA